VCFARICGRAIFSPDERFFSWPMGCVLVFLVSVGLPSAVFRPMVANFLLMRSPNFQQGAEWSLFFRSLIRSSFSLLQLLRLHKLAASPSDGVCCSTSESMLLGIRGTVLPGVLDLRGVSAWRPWFETGALPRRLACAFLVRGWGPRELQNRQAQYARPATNFVTDAQVGLTERLRATLDVSERVVQNFTSAISEQQESRLKRDGLDRKKSHGLSSADSCTAGDAETWWNAQRFVSHSAHSTAEQWS